MLLKIFKDEIIEQVRLTVNFDTRMQQCRCLKQISLYIASQMLNIQSCNQVNSKNKVDFFLESN